MTFAMRVSVVALLVCGCDTWSPGDRAMVSYPGPPDAGFSVFGSWLDKPGNDPLSERRSRPGGSTFPQPSVGDEVLIVDFHQPTGLATVRFVTGVREGKTHRWPAEWLTRTSR